MTRWRYVPIATSGHKQCHHDSKSWIFHSSTWINLIVIEQGTIYRGCAHLFLRLLPPPFVVRKNICISYTIYYVECLSLRNYKGLTDNIILASIESRISRISKNIIFFLKIAFYYFPRDKLRDWMWIPIARTKNYVRTRCCCLLHTFAKRVLLFAFWPKYF